MSLLVPKTFEAYFMVNGAAQTARHLGRAPKKRALPPFDLLIYQTMIRAAQRGLVRREKLILKFSISPLFFKERPILKKLYKRPL
jgi:hypothetical protein